MLWREHWFSMFHQGEQVGVWGGEGKASRAQCWVIATGSWLPSEGVEFSPLWAVLQVLTIFLLLGTMGSISASKILDRHKKVVIIVGSEKDFVCKLGLFPSLAFF